MHITTKVKIIGVNGKALEKATEVMLEYKRSIRENKVMKLTV